MLLAIWEKSVLGPENKCKGPVSVPGVLEEPTDHHVGWTRGRMTGENGVSCHGRRQQIDRVRTHKLWLSLWVARGAFGVF